MTPGFRKPGTELLDERGFAEDGEHPPKGPPPSPPLVVRRGLGVGPDWVGVGRGERWRFITFNDIYAVAITPAPAFKLWWFSRSLYAPGPDLVIRGRQGYVIDVDVRRVSAEVRQALLAGIGPHPGMTPVARAFLESGRLPGRFGRSPGYGRYRFGPERDR